MSFPRCLYLFQYYLLNCMMLACINIWIRWDGDGQMNGKIWWKPTSSSNNRELWKYLYIMGVYLVLASCLFFFASSPILAIRWQRSKCLIGLWQGLERFPCHLYHLRSPAVSSSSSSVNMVASAYIKKLWWSWGGGASIPAAWHPPHWGWGYPACLQEHLRCHDVSLTSTAGRRSTPMLPLGPHAIWVFPNSKSSFHSISS